MSVVKDLYKLFCKGSKAWAYAKLCQKTGMTPPDVDIWIDVYKNSSKAIESQTEIYLQNLWSVYRPKLKTIKQPAGMCPKTVKALPVSDDIKQKIIKPQPIKSRVLNCMN